MFLPGIGIMTWKDAQPRIPWGTVILFGVGISLGAALLQTKGAVWLADIVVAEFGLRQASTMFILAVMTLFLIAIHLGFASATALAAAMIPIVIAVLQGVATPGINVIGMTMLLQFVSELRLHSCGERATEHGGVWHRYFRGPGLRSHRSRAHRHCLCACHGAGSHILALARLRVIPNVKNTAFNRVCRQRRIWRHDHRSGASAVGCQAGSGRMHLVSDTDIL